MAAGVVGFVLELVHGNDIWSRHAWGFALVAAGLYCGWRGLSERASGGGSGRPIWPAVALFVILAATAVILYAIAPPAAVLFAIVVLPFCWGARVQGWFSSE